MKRHEDYAGINSTLIFLDSIDTIRYSHLCIIIWDSGACLIPVLNKNHKSRMKVRSNQQYEMEIQGLADSKMRSWILSVGFCCLNVCCTTAPSNSMSYAEVIHQFVHGKSCIAMGDDWVTQQQLSMTLNAEESPMRCSMSDQNGPSPNSEGNHAFASRHVAKPCMELMEW